MKIYQLKIQYDPEKVLTIATYLNESDAFEALADWSENEKAIQKFWDSLTEKQMDYNYNKICERIPDIYNAYDHSGWVEECEVIKNYDPKSLDFDFKLLKL